MHQVLDFPDLGYSNRTRLAPYKSSREQHADTHGCIAAFHVYRNGQSQILGATLIGSSQLSNLVLQHEVENHFKRLSTK